MGTTIEPGRMLKQSANTKKVEAQAKVEIKRVGSLLNLDLDLSSTFRNAGGFFQRPAKDAIGPEMVFVRSITSSSLVLANNVSQRLCR